MGDFIQQVILEVVSTCIAAGAVAFSGLALVAWYRKRKMKVAVEAIIERMKSILGQSTADQHISATADMRNLEQYFDEEMDRVDEGIIRPNRCTRRKIEKLRQEVLDWRNKFTVGGNHWSVMNAVTEGMQTKRGKQTESDLLANSLRAFVAGLSILSFFEL